MPLRLLTALTCSSALALAPFTSLSSQDKPVATVTLEYGNDSGEWAFDGECDDVRFDGEGMAEVLLTDSIGKDATDCQVAFEAGKISVDPMHAEPANDADIKFGDDTSEFAKDGECDDIRFAGKGSDAIIYIAEDIGRDASDCREAFEAGAVAWQGSSAEPEHGVTADEILEKMRESSITT